MTSILQAVKKNEGQQWISIEELWQGENRPIRGIVMALLGLKSSHDYDMGWGGRAARQVEVALEDLESSHACDGVSVGFEEQPDL